MTQSSRDSKKITKKRSKSNFKKRMEMWWELYWFQEERGRVLYFFLVALSQQAKVTIIFNQMNQSEMNEGDENRGGIGWCLLSFCIQKKIPSSSSFIYFDFKVYVTLENGESEEARVSIHYV